MDRNHRLEAMAEYRENSETRSYSCDLSLGYLLSAFQQRIIDDAGFMIAESHIPGLGRPPS